MAGSLADRTPCLVAIPQPAVWTVRDDRQAEDFGELPVALVVAGTAMMAPVP